LDILDKETEGRSGGALLPRQLGERRLALGGVEVDLHDHLRAEAHQLEAVDGESSAGGGAAPARFMVDDIFSPESSVMLQYDRWGS
jgi:hypothetical protein